MDLRLPRVFLHGLLPVAVLFGGAATLPSRAQGSSDAGSKGAQVYCFMRGAGNNHQVSWDAAYALIKRQSASLFKTSPEHGAVMITEAVVQNPGTYPDCGRFLGDLYAKPQADAGSATSPDSPRPSSGMTREQRYSY
ncbi:DUF6554 family protein [Synechococcus sp. CCY9201]|jgi:hypothetical protein|uniref:DUF6554 family protein n=1 Tax=unclassified Synechococcus TaxID=2626047 RepID=UPI001E5EC58A|nr:MULTISPECIES: DUF6554 family protein [unclassified Synechococcus]MEA5475785.1 DUF6554 family protein [Synechococcus sp. CCY9201]CAK6687048.1 hypothetical protein IFHNHDMJ_00121 [Synechococcus sp. CBW1107]